MKQSHKTIAGWVILVLLAAWAFKFWNVPLKNEKQITYSEFKEAIKSGEVVQITFKQGEVNRIHGEYQAKTPEGETPSTVRDRSGPYFFVGLPALKLVSFGG